MFCLQNAKLNRPIMTQAVKKAEYGKFEILTVSFLEIGSRVITASSEECFFGTLFQKF
jgi:hypothetical protein